MTSIQLYWFLLASGWVLLEIFIVIKTRVSCLLMDQQKYRSEHLIWLVVTISLILALIIKQLHFAGIPIDYVKRQYIAFILFSLGLLIRFYAVLSLGGFFSTTAMTRPQHVLIEYGPYKWVRHPAYTGLLISFFASGLAMGDALALLILIVPVTYVLYQRIHVEEQGLIDYFGPVYYDYCLRTKKLLPWLY